MNAAREFLRVGGKLRRREGYHLLDRIHLRLGFGPLGALREPLNTATTTNEKDDDR